MGKNDKDDVMNLETALSTKKDEPGFWREIWQQIRLVYYLIRDPEVPIYLKLIPFTAVIYLIWPIDLIADVIPVLGQLDDLTALLVTSKVFVELVPQHVVAKHLDSIRTNDGYTAISSPQEDSDEQLADAIVIDGEHELIVEKTQSED